MMLHRRPFVKAVATSMRDDCFIEPGDRILAAVSGGADSVALLRALAALASRKQWSLDLHVAHINHHLRADADADEAFVADLAASLKLKFHRADIHPADLGGNLEANARDERYAALLTIADDIAADLIATAHHADDQLETMLMRLIRGASVYGLAGILPRRRLTNHHALIRPMLGVDRAAGIEFLTSIGQTWREDHTNADTSRWRARLRADVLPVLRELRPGAAIKAVGVSRNLHETGQLLSRAVREIEDQVVERRLHGPASMPREIARGLSPVVLSEITRRMCLHVGSPPDGFSAALLDPIVAAMRDGSGERRIFQLPGNIRVVVDAGVVWWKPRDMAV